MIKKLKNFYHIYGITHIKSWIMHLLVLISLITLDFQYFLFAIGFYFIAMPVLQTIIHDYICHEYVIPKNKFIDFIFLLIFYIHSGRSVVSKRDYHVTHHKYWQNSEKDPPQIKMKNVSVWQYIFDLQRPVEQKLDKVENSLLENNMNVQLLDPYADKIYWIYVLIMFIILPWPWFVTIVVYVPWLLVTILGCHDILFHHKDFQSKDRSIYLPIYGNGAWHLRHHKEYAYNYYGPGFLPKLNPAWYFKKIFFNDNLHNPA